MKGIITNFGLSALMGIFLTSSPGQISPESEQGIEVQTRGPVHEAFAQPLSQRQGPGPLIPKKPPDPIKEMPPEQKPEGDYVLWIPGYWAWDEDRSDFLWVSGVWRAPPVNHRWIPGYWQEDQGGWRWIAGYWVDAATNTTQYYPAPPDSPEEAIPPAPNTDSTYIPGTWIYVQNEYRWRPGQWLANQVGWIWNPARYCWTPGGYVFVNGFWDHDLLHRGLCFAPVSIDPRFYGRPGWYYRPLYAIAADALLSSLFVHTGWGHYYFGDYYDPAYARRGYVPWFDHRTGHASDPLFSYYRWENRNNARWADNLQKTYVARRDGQVARPAHTLSQYEGDLAKNKTQAVRLVAPVNQWPEKSFKLQAVPKAHVEEIQKNNEQWQNLRVQRRQLETTIQPKSVVVEKQTAPVQKQTAPVQKQAAPVQKQAAPVQKQAAPVQKQAAPVQVHNVELPRTTISAPAVVRPQPPPPVHPQPQVVPHKEKDKGK